MLAMADTEKWDYESPVTLTIVRGLLLIQFLSLFVIPCFLFAYFSDAKPIKYLGLKSSLPVYFLSGAAVLIVAIPFVEWTGVINNRLIPESTAIGKWMKESEESAAKQVAFLLKKNTIKDLLMNLLFIAGFAGIGEELFFRGVLQRIFIKWFRSVWVGIIITAFLFSAIHFQFYGFIPRFILGILLGMIYWYSGSLWPAMLAHFVYDGFAVVMVYFNPAFADQETPVFNTGSQAIAALISAILVAAIIYYMKKKSTNNYEAVYTGDKIENDNPFSF